MSTTQTPLSLKGEAAEGVGVRVYTLDEQLHRLAARQAQRDRFLMRALAVPPCQRKSFARQIEIAIAEQLRAAGYIVSRTGANAHFDLLVDSLRVEVKAATLSGGRYQAALRSNNADILIFVCRDPDGDDHHFVIPFDEVRGLTHIEIHNPDPSAYAG